MDRKQRLNLKLIGLLQDIDFARRYYAYCDAHPRPKVEWAPSQSELQTALASTSLAFEYRSKERFFLHDEDFDEGTVSLRVAFPAGSVEMILYVKIGSDYIGGPFPVLARQLAQSANPPFAHSPPYPKLPAWDHESLHEALNLGIELFHSANAVIRSAKGWKNEESE